MLSAARNRILHLAPSTRLPIPTHLRGYSKRTGDISDAFASLSGQDFRPLGPEYAALKKRLISGHEDKVKESWGRLLKVLREDVAEVAALGSSVIPEIEFGELNAACGCKNRGLKGAFSEKLRKRGVAIVRGVVDASEALAWKEEIRSYVRENPGTKAFPKSNPQVFELYWTRPQLLARSHPNLLKTQKFLMSHWHATPSSLISTNHPVTYADRLRIRQSGDNKFALGPHVDGGSVERWDERGYGLGGVYDDIWNGEWENFDAWDAARRLAVNPDLHGGVGACSMFRMFQGWLSLSTTGPGEGTLLVNALLKQATAYHLLRPFFSPRRGVAADAQSPASEALAVSEDFLDESNWELDIEPTSWLQGATPGHGQELSTLLHPHLQLHKSMLHIPKVEPGDYVAWHCDTIHAVDKTHNGPADSSVLYIPACPLTVANAQGLVRQREAFVAGTPSPDFGGGVGERDHVGRVKVEEVEGLVSADGERGMGLREWDSGEEGLVKGEREVLLRANRILGFYD